MTLKRCTYSIERKIKKGLEERRALAKEELYKRRSLHDGPRAIGIDNFAG
jgi:hypothetical protein